VRTAADYYYKQERRIISRAQSAAELRRPRGRLHKVRFRLKPANILLDIEWRMHYGWFARRVREAALRQMLVFGPPGRVHLDENCDLSGSTLNVMSGTITIGAWTFVGHNVSLLAGSHDVTKRHEDRYRNIPREGYDIVIGDGVWLGSGCIVIGPCQIGDNAVIAAGAVVTHDVPADTIVGGVPARVIGSC
jgi:carbonic anhydrase/acetyltransferase-like protein (isoleucine patch superfamily)